MTTLDPALANNVEIILKRSKKLGTSADCYVLRKALDAFSQESPNQGGGNLALWGQAMARLLDIQNRLELSNLSDARRLHAYMVAMEKTPIEVLMADNDIELGVSTSITGTAKPVYDAMVDVSQSLAPTWGETKSHPLLWHLVKQGHWNPHALLCKLHANLQNEYDYLDATFDDRTNIHLTVLCDWLQLSVPLLADTPWTPPRHTLYKSLWESVPYQDCKTVEQRQRYGQLIHNAMHKAPEYAPDALLCLSRSMSSGHLATYDFWDVVFPLATTSAPPKQFLEALVVFVHESRKDTPKAEELLARHHPEIHQLVALHLSVFGPPEAGKPLDVGHLLEAYTSVTTKPEKTQSIALPFGIEA